jgi:hypothetical protein
MWATVLAPLSLVGLPTALLDHVYKGEYTSQAHLTWCNMIPAPQFGGRYINCTCTYSAYIWTYVHTGLGRGVYSPD